ncbi:hypothetical protein [Immundisolibacter sp.]
MICKKCNLETLKGETLCKDHWIEARYQSQNYLDNSNPEDLGILKWARDMMPEYLPQATPKFHIEMLMLLFSLFDPFYKNRYERQLNIISFRGSSKSTLVNMLFAEYLLCHNGKHMTILSINNEKVDVLIKERLIVIGSETGMSAEDFVVRLRDELTSNPNLRFFYGAKIEDAYDALDGQWTRRAFKFNSCYILSAGVGQQIRGKIKGASRPTTILLDDIYSENNTITEDGRNKVRKWFDSAVHNTLDDLLGKIVVVGTILHEDTILVTNKLSKNWKTVEFPVMNPNKFARFIREHLEVVHQRGSCQLPYEGKGLSEYELKTLQREYFEKVQNSEDWELAWKERIDLYFLALKYQDAIVRGSLGSLYQEYFHQPVSDEMKRIKPEYFRHMKEYTLYSEFGYDWFKCDLFDQAYTINIEIGLDTGTGTPDGDDSVATVAGILSNGYRVIFKQIAGKYDLRDVREDTGLLNLGRLVMDRDMLKKIGILDEALRLAVEYKAKVIKIGYAGSEKNNVTLLTQLAEANKMYNITILGRRQDSAEGTKRERILNKIAPYYQSYSVIHNQNLERLETQLQNLMRTTEDDLADSAEVSMWNMQQPFHVDVSIFKQKPQIRWKGNYKPITDFDWRVIN